MPTPFESFVNTELPKRLATNESPISPQAGEIPVFSGVGLLTEAKTKAEAGIASSTDLSNHVSGVDPHGDRAYSVQRSNHTGTQTASTISDFNTAAAAAAPVQSVHGRTGAVVSANGDYTVAQVTNAQQTSAQLEALRVFNSNGLLTQTAANTFVARMLEAAAGHGTWTNPAGIAGNPSFALANTAVTAGSYGSSSQVPVVVVDAQGRITGLTTVAVSSPAVFSDAAFRIQDNSDATKQKAFECSGLPTATTRTQTVANKDWNEGDLSNVATTNSNVLTGTRGHIVGGQGNTVSGTDNVAEGCQDVILSGVRQTATNAKGIPASMTTRGVKLRGGTGIILTGGGGAQQPTIAETELIWYAAGNEFTTNGLAGTTTNRVFAVIDTPIGQMAVHDITCVVASLAGSSILVHMGYVTYRVLVSYDGLLITTSILDTTLKDSYLHAGTTLTLAITLSGKNLVITPTYSGSGETQPFYPTAVFVESKYVRGL